MEISGIGTRLQNLFQNNAKETAHIQHEGIADRVDVHETPLLSDEEVDDVLNDTMAMITNDPAGALTVHSGLSESRVFALLGI